jgi:transcription elongation factor Elf1
MPEILTCPVCGREASSATVDYCKTVLPMYTFWPCGHEHLASVAVLLRRPCGTGWPG